MIKLCNGFTLLSFLIPKFQYLFNIGTFLFSFVKKGSAYCNSKLLWRLSFEKTSLKTCIVRKAMVIHHEKVTKRLHPNNFTDR